MYKCSSQKNGDESTLVSEDQRKYLETFDHLKDQDKACLNHTLEPAPGWFSRYRRNLAPSSEKLEQLPKGPAAYSSNGHDQTLRSQK